MNNVCIMLLCDIFYSGERKNYNNYLQLKYIYKLDTCPLSVDPTLVFTN